MLTYFLDPLLTFFWPILWARSMACKSFIGFQSCSTKITVSAPVRLRPRPPKKNRVHKSSGNDPMNRLQACILQNSWVQGFLKPLVVTSLIQFSILTLVLTFKCKVLKLIIINRVKKHHYWSRSLLEDKLTDGGREQEDVDGGVVVEPVDEVHPVVGRHRPVETKEGDVGHRPQYVALHDVHHGLELTEDQHPVLVHDPGFLK